MTLQQLRYFLAASRHESFAAAAESLSLAQPSLSDQVRRLEAELGVRLFIRSGRRLQLTEAGRTLAPHAERVLDAVELAANSVADVRNLRGGTASLGTFGVAYHYFVREVIAECLERHPELKVRIVGQNTVEVCEMIRRGEIEAGLVTLPIDEAGFEVRPVMTDELLFVTLDGSETQGPITIEELVKMPRGIAYSAHYGSRDPTWRGMIDWAEDSGLKLDNVTIEVDSLPAALGLAVRGLGATVVLRTVAEEPSFPKELRTVSFDPPRYETFAFIHSSGAQLSPATAELVRLTEEQILRHGAQVRPEG